MQGPECFFKLGELCFAQQNTLMAAAVTAAATLLTSGIGLWSARKALAHQASERAARDEFDMALARAKEDFERSEREAQNRFDVARAGLVSELEAKLQRELQTHLKLVAWTEAIWKRNLERLDVAVPQLEETMKGLIELIDQGPLLDDVPMIKRTAQVLSKLGDFTSSIEHFDMPNGIALQSRALIELITKTVITLSPSKSNRQSPDRIRDLGKLKEQLKKDVAQFKELCAWFGRDPSAFQGLVSEGMKHVPVSLWTGARAPAPARPAPSSVRAARRTTTACSLSWYRAASIRGA